MPGQLFYEAEPNAFSEAIIEYWEQQATEERQIRLDNDLYEHSAE